MNQVKSYLPQLLATENIKVEHQDVPTAYFDLKNRVLGLPNWDNMSKDVYDLLVGHEVSHALYTPRVSLKELGEKVDSQNADAVASYYNIVEDARIEKLIKRKFPGLKKCMFRGYKELVEQDLFKIKDKTISELSFVDRINLHFKIGNIVDVPFHSETEKRFVEEIGKSETFEEVDSIVKRLYDYIQERGDVNDFQQIPSYMEGDDIDEDEIDEFYRYVNENGGLKDTPNSDGEGSEDSEDSEDGENTLSGGFEGADKPSLKGSQTQSDFDSSLREKVKSDQYPKFYTSIPEIPEDVIRRYVEGWKDVHERLDNHFKPEEKQLYLSEFQKFRKEHMKTVNYLVKEFELKKNADQHARASISKTGVIDVNKLHGYKFNEDLFKRVTTIPGGKNHGLIMFVDFSGSMQNCIEDTINQLMILTMFCDKVKIPYEVYSFTSTGMNYGDYDEVYDIETLHSPTKEKDLVLGYFRLRQYFSSEMRGRQWINAMSNMIGIRNAHEGYQQGYSLPNEDQLGSTPLNQCIIVSLSLIEMFQKRFGIQKVTSVFLTDGQSDSMSEIWKRQDKTLVKDFFTHWNTQIMIHDPVTKMDYSVDDRDDITNVLLQIIRDRYGIDVVGFYIAHDRWSVKNVYSSLTDMSLIHGNWKEILKKLRTDKCSVIEGKDIRIGYSEFYVVGGSKDGLKVDTDELVLDNQRTRRVRVNQFKKHMKSKTVNKVLLNNFVRIIA